MSRVMERARKHDSDFKQRKLGSADFDKWFSGYEFLETYE